MAETKTGKAASGCKKPADVTGRKLTQMGLTRPVDFCLHLPIRYEDETRISRITDAPWDQPVQLELDIISVSTQYKPRKQLLVLAKDDSGEIYLRFLNFYGSQIGQFEAAKSSGQSVRAFGEVRQGFFGAEMVHPRTRFVGTETPLPSGLTPVYPTTAGISQALLRRRIGSAMSGMVWGEPIDSISLAALELWPLQQALNYLHNPPVSAPISQLSERDHPAWDRVKFDELLAQQLSLRKAYQTRRSVGAPPLRTTGALAAALLKSLPFGLTGAQARVAQEIFGDLQLEFPMQRLLQGDVGSGKTIVGALAACQAIEAGYQVAFMAPTEILAEQHYKKLQHWLTPLGVRVIWLTGSLKKAGKLAAQAALHEGAQLVVGTHALIQDNVEFPKLGLAIVDEQHRFGVAQRLALRQKGCNPHQLMMSATPIPRTLAMSYYADLDVSVIDELPPGRTPIRTRLVSDARRDQVVGFAEKRLEEGRQVYWVCPLIEESEALQLQTAIQTFEELSEALPSRCVGLVHGRLKPNEKAAVMDAFVAGEVLVLVATTVIEVGVDVPNASLMVIEHAERFGLSQLHQLRGRVGRGQWASDCILLYCNPLSPTARERLRIVFEHTDGFEIARQDLQLRGPGEFIGSRQSGVPLLRYADLEKDEHWVEASRRVAEELLAENPVAAEAHLERWLGSQAELLKA
ncbi:MAG: hypothetical protein RIR18_1995 [Pseudomonadota bacterium]